MRRLWSKAIRREKVRGYVENTLWKVIEKKISKYTGKLLVNEALYSRLNRIPSSQFY